MASYEILAKEAQLIYNRAPGFNPVNGDLTHWKGKINTRNVQSPIEIELKLPVEFPKEPPIVNCLTPIKHKIIDSESKEFNLKILKKWKPKYHIYEVINIIKGEFAKEKPVIVESLKKIDKPGISHSKAGSVDSSIGLESKLKELENEVQELQRKIEEKDEEIIRLQSYLKAHDVKSTELKETELESDNLLLNLEGERIATEELISKLEEKFESGDITVEDYSRVYKKYRKKLFSIQKKIEELKK